MQTVEEPFKLADADAAQSFLRTFSAEARRQGTALLRRGAVSDIQVLRPAESFGAVVVEGPNIYAVELLEKHGAWRAKCPCPDGGGKCAHAFAAMSVVLTEHRAALVRQLSTGAVSVSSARLEKKPAPEVEPTMADRVVTALGRPLKGQEFRFLSLLAGLYQRCTRNQRLTFADLQGLGFYRLQGYGWIFPEIWPEFPRNEYEFWLYVANFLIQQGAQIPDFMVPITDLSVVEQKLASARRAAEVDKWRKNFIGASIADEGLPKDGEIDLRLVVQGPVARLQWRPVHEAEFQPFRQQQFRQLEMDHSAGRVSFTTEGEVLWQLFKSAAETGMKLDLDSYHPATLRVVGRILRSRALQDRVVDSSGKPLRRFAEPLAWRVSAPENSDGDYRILLVQQDGTPPPPLLCVLPGRPGLYLTTEGLFPGPPNGDRVLDPSTENLVPAPALESADGVLFLETLGVELPTKLKERVRKVPWEISISCALQPIYPGSEADDCAVVVQARAADGHEQFWDGLGWQSKTGGRKKSKSKDGTITVYDAAALNRVSSLLQPLNLKPARYSNSLVMRVTRNFAETFVDWLRSIPPDIHVHLDGELASLTCTDVVGRVKLEVTEAEIDWFDLRVVLDVANTTLTADEIKLLLNAKGGYVRLRGKGWRRLQYDLNENENDELARLGLSPRELSAEPQRLHALQLADPASKRFLPQQQVEQIRRRAAELKARVAPDVPASITAQMRPYQLEGFHFLAYLATNRFGGILADDMGLGKTLQTLAWLVWLREQNPASALAPTSKKLPAQRATLVICPKSVMDNWRAEAERFAPGLRIRVWSASELKSFSDELNSADLHVLNYSQLRSLSDVLGSVSWLAVVLDEGQYIKNPNSQTAQIARSLTAQYRLVLSGTPIENRLLDLWSLMAFTMPGVLGNRASFARLYDSKGDPLARRRLAARVRPFLLRRTKAQVAKDLPDRVEEDLFCEIEGEQKALYRAELKAAQQLLLGVNSQKELNRQQFHFLTCLLRLRQICCHPRLLQPECAASSAKTDALLEQLEPLMEEGQKVLVFSQFVQMLDLLRPQLEQRQWPVFYLAGQTENRGELVRRFQEAQGPGVFLISLKAGGFGLNLTAASYVILFDPWWNPAVENQAIDRTHRIGQTSKVMAYRLLIKNSIEEKIRELQKKKHALAEDVFGEEKFAQSLTVEDLQFLLAD